MEAPTTIYVKLDTDKEVRVELTHVTEGIGAPHEKNRERGLTPAEVLHASKRIAAHDYTCHSNL